MKKVSRICLLLILFSLVTADFVIKAQEKTQLAPVQTAVPSLTIAPDARGGAMGDNGVATTPDVNSQYWNPAKYAFNYSKAGVSLSYTPWLRKLVNDIALVNLSGFYKLGNSDMQALGASVRYFSLGEISDTEYMGQGGSGVTLNPYEMAVDISYSRKLSEYYSMAVALRYIRSDLGADSRSDGQTAGNAFAADIAGYLEKYVILGNSECLWSFGYNVSNIGSKISFDGGETSRFLPAKLTVGTGLLYPIDDYNRIGAYVDLSKYLVPNYPTKGDNNSEESDEDYQKRLEDYRSMSSISGIFKSFGDNPNGFKGEMQEIMASIGLEYSYNEQFFVRGGYYYENKNMGNRQYFSVGAGFRMSVFQLDAAYLVSTVQSNPLDQTLRFSLSFDMDGIRNLFR
ncbi:type IX secretion system outer membrane channel protein PorV [Parabacteroides bouchesdurhonensis]|uniref:type IX secretion system outer membrane channel protein PorV n=1 Tax=Parabacteroides bouchesdurhonensis TaxID=1936995 RepID=UPI000C8509D1|nr:type IX secretion system outer membrane channel protein PorV [Parabacteroides bouchesdurhonensis]